MLPINKPKHPSGSINYWFPARSMELPLIHLTTKWREIFGSRGTEFNKVANAHNPQSRHCNYTDFFQTLTLTIVSKQSWLHESDTVRWKVYNFYSAPFKMNGFKINSDTQWKTLYISDIKKLIVYLIPQEHKQTTKQNESILWKE